MTPPPYIALVMPPFLRIESLDGAKRDDLARKGLTVEREWWFYRGIRFPDTGGDLLANAALVGILRRLNEAGIAFGEDYKQGLSPADLMRELQARGDIAGPFTAIAWRGPGEWFTSVHEKK